MKHILISAISILLASAGEVTAIESAALMPQEADFTQMWWAEGFPAHTPTAPWLRVIQTGRYAMALNTETLRVEHLGAVTSLTEDFKKLPPADLVLNVSVNGKTYRCTAGGKWTRWSGPRLIESGRFFQRGDVTGLEFKAEGGTRLDVEARFETAAWSDRLGLILAVRPAEPWKSAVMEIQIAEVKKRWEGQNWAEGEWRELAISFDPVTGRESELQSAVSVKATEWAKNIERPVSYDAARGWHVVNLDGIEPMVPPGTKNPSNDAIERVKLSLANSSGSEQVARLMFEKTTHGFRQRIGSCITGVSAMLRDSEGRPTGIPVQLSKNWHNEPEGGVYASQWFHGISQVRLPAKASVELELTLAYGHWGGVPAASHSQLSLIGWGSNQLWDQSALGAWGESICYEPDQAQANCTITDVRPAMVKLADGKPWTWTGNVGGGDFFRFFNPAGHRLPHSAMRTTYHKQGPCLTEVTYAGRIGPTMTHSITTSLARTDDIVRATYQVRLDVKALTDLTRFVIFQMGADTYNQTPVHKVALGNESGLTREWNTQPGGNLYRTESMQCRGRIPWISLHEANPKPSKEDKPIANRGIIIRQWKAKLGGQEAVPWIAERGLTFHRQDSSTLDVLPPPGVKQLQPGDFVEATIEFIVMPLNSADYYGPNEALRKALARNANTWRMVEREAVGNDRRVEMKTGTLLRTHPAIAIRTVNGEAEFTITGGIGYVPVTFTELKTPNGCALLIDDKTLDQSIHGNDFWQTDYDATTKRWSQTFNVPADGLQAQKVRLIRHP